VSWGCPFSVLKSGGSAIPPLTYNAIRYLIALPLISLPALRYRAVFRVPLRDLLLMILVFSVGSTGYQILFAYALRLTTSTNTALVVATMPAWTAVLSVGMGAVVLRRKLLIGLGMTLVGIAIVVLGGAGAQVGLSGDDLRGSGLAMVGAIITAAGNLASKPLVDRLGGVRVALWSYWITAAGLTLVALPDLSHLTADTLPPRLWPNVLYSGVLSSGLGVFVWNYALRELGPTRAVSYQNFPPLIAALAGIVFLGDPITVGLVVGGTLTLLGVVLVRRNTYLRPGKLAQG